MRTSTLPRHARSGVRALGWRKARPGEAAGLHPVWPILGGAPDDDSDDDDQDDGDDEGDQGDGEGTQSDKDDDGEWSAVLKQWQAEGLKPNQVAERLKASRKWEERAKANKGAAAELAKLKREGMSDVEKKVDEAVASARAEERVKSGVRVARSAFMAAAKGRISDPKEVVEDINLKKYVDDEGEVDDEAIAKLVDRLAPKGSDKDEDEDDDREDERDTRRRRRSLDQGARRRGGPGSKRGSNVDGDALFEELLGRKPTTAQS
ncbi:hypothetical protein [Streptomyces sp. B15]|uniref:hypothetical protein n=1 Tax=Streptomyces sp. B15 TaxID=1537797 RepID=UPI001B366B49|nr:hypothetical protein [Streptomyces sp. B15]MBQ1122639.1 hypothetical protein [Streptomyces sp. B15]